MENEELKSQFWKEITNLASAGIYLASHALRVARPDLSMICNETTPPISNRLIIAPFENDFIDGCFYLKPEEGNEPSLYAMTTYITPPLTKISLTDGSVYDILTKVPSSDKNLKRLLNEKSINFYLQDVEKLFPRELMKKRKWSRTNISSGNTLAGAIPILD